jgi:hypothetical protein
MSRRPFRRRNLLLAVPGFGLVGLVACTLVGAGDGWLLACVAVSGSAIGIYLLIERFLPRP